MLKMLIMFLYSSELLYNAEQRMGTHTDGTVEASFEVELVAEWVSLNMLLANIS